MSRNGFTPIIILLIVGILGGIGYFSYTKGYLDTFFSKQSSTFNQKPTSIPTPKETNYPTVIPTKQPTNSGIVTGSVLIYSMDVNTMTVQFVAQSTKGNITEMMVWTDSNQTKNWQKFSTLLTLPVNENVYVKYRDNLNNESQMYTDTTIPKNGPPQQP